MSIIKVATKNGAGTQGVSASECRDYLLGLGRWFEKYQGKRCSRVDYISIPSDAPGKPTWDKRMDSTRTLYGTDRHKNQRHYMHYIFSPDPEDNVSETELSSAIKEWCERCYQGKFQIVIGYHNDNKNRVQHAHLFINNTNLDPAATKHTIAGYMTPSFMEYHKQLWQYICKERGWNNFLDKQKTDIEEIDNSYNISEDTKRLFEIDEKYFKEFKYFNPEINYSRPYKNSIMQSNKIYTDFSKKPPFSTKNGRNYTKAALSAKARGEQLWTDDIRNLVETAYYQSSTIEQFEKSLVALDLKFDITDNGEYKFAHPDCDKNPAWVVTGAKLGSDYKRQRIMNLYSKVKSGNKVVYRPSLQIYEKFITKIREVGYSPEVRHISLLDKDNSLTIQDIATAMRINSYYDIWEFEDYSIQLHQRKDYKALNDIQFAQDVMKKLDGLAPLRQSYEKNNDYNWVERDLIDVKSRLKMQEWFKEHSKDIKRKEKEITSEIKGKAHNVTVEKKQTGKERDKGAR